MYIIHSWSVGNEYGAPCISISILIAAALLSSSQVDPPAGDGGSLSRPREDVGRGSRPSGKGCYKRNTFI